MRIAVVGAGGIAKKAYFPLLAIMPDVEIVAVHSRTQERVDNICQRWNLPLGTTDLNQIISSEPQAVLVISSTESHYHICRMMLEKGIDVYVEKSLTTDSRKSLELHEIAIKNKRILSVGFNRRYAPLYKKAKELLGERKIQMAIIQKHRTSASYRTLFDQFLDDTIHQIDLLRYFCGEVTPLSTSYKIDKDAVSSVVCTTSIPSGGHCILMISNHAGSWQESVTLHAEGITIHVDAFHALRVMYDDHEEIFGTDRAGKWITSMEERGFYGELAHFFECTKSRQFPLTNAEEAAKTQLLLEGLIRVSKDEIIRQE